MGAPVQQHLQRQKIKEDMQIDKKEYSSAKFILFIQYFLIFPSNDTLLICSLAIGNYNPQNILFLPYEDTYIL